MSPHASSFVLHDAVCSCESFSRFNAEVFPTLVADIGADSATFQAINRHAEGLRQERQAYLGLSRESCELYEQRFFSTYFPLLFQSMPANVPGDVLQVSASQGQRVEAERELWSLSGVGSVLMLRIVAFDGERFLLGLHRRVRDRAFSARDRRRIGALAPALRSTLRRLQLEETLAARSSMATGHEGSASASPLAVLTRREQDLAAQVALGLSNKAIARQWGISLYTVENHLRSIYRKLEVNNRTQLAALCRPAA